MSWVAVSVGMGVVNAGVGIYSADKAADAVEQGNNRAIGEQRRQFDTVVGLNRPYSVTGTGALNTLAKLYGLPYADYQDPSTFAGGSDVSNPRAVKGQRFSNRKVNKLLRQGYSVEDITKMGYLGGRLNPQRIKKLSRKGLSADDINTLMEGKAGADAAAREQEAADGIHTPTGPDMSVFTESPDYQYNLKQTGDAVERTAASRSGALNGNTVMAAEENASGLASREFSNFFGRLATIAGIGQQAAQSTGNAAQDTGRVVSSLLTDSGQARASGVMGGANSVSDAVNSGLSTWLLSRGGYFDAPARTPSEDGGL